MKSVSSHNPAAIARRGALARTMEVLGSEKVLPYLFIAPVVIIVLGLITYPFINGLWLSLHRKFVGYPPKFVGLHHYHKLLFDSFFQQAVRNSFVYTIGAVFWKLVLGMTMALVLNQQIRLRNLWRGLLYLPWIAPTVVTALTWLWMFDAVKGVFNVMAIQWGMMSAKDPVDWLGGANTAMFAVMTVNIWRGIPFFGISLYAGLQTIPEALYEAAEVDGASAVQKFIYITVPSLKNVIIVTTLLSTIWTFNDFNIVFLMTRGGPGGATQIFATLTYEIGFQGLRWGEAVAVSIYLLPGLAAVIVLLARYLRRD